MEDLTWEYELPGISRLSSVYSPMGEEIHQANRCRDWQQEVIGKKWKPSKLVQGIDNFYNSQGECYTLQR